MLKTFPKIDVPTLVIWGMKDAALLPVQLEALDELIEDVRIVRLPGAGHFAPWEAPDAVAEALEPFLAEDAPAIAPAK
jgi:pimeloyl-ACP methyl ester carboxylesterase